MRNAARLNQLLLFLRIAAPEEKRLGRRLLGKRSDNPVCQNFPPFFRVASGRAFFDSQNRVQKQDALRRPAGKIAVSRDIASELKRDFLIDIPKRRRNPYSLLNREREALRLSLLVIRILSDDDHPHRVRGSERQSPEGSRWKYHGPGFPARVEISVQLFPFGGFKEILQERLPAWICGLNIKHRKVPSGPLPDSPSS